MSEWDPLDTFEDWAGKLDELLDEATAKLNNNQSAVEVQKRLRGFRLNTPLGPRFDKLNAIAAEAVQNIAAETVAAAIERIASRSNELDDVLLQLRGASSAGDRMARIINLETPTTIVTSLTETVGAFKQLRDGLDLPDGVDAEEIEKRIGSAISAITKLRDAIESAT